MCLSRKVRSIAKHASYAVVKARFLRFDVTYSRILAMLSMCSRNLRWGPGM